MGNKRHESLWYRPGDMRQYGEPVDGDYRWDPVNQIIDGNRIGDVTLVPFDPEFHGPESVSRLRPQKCAHGGQDTCPNEPLFSVLGAHWRISACAVHLHGALYDALHRGRRSDDHGPATPMHGTARL